MSRIDETTAEAILAMSMIRASLLNEIIIISYNYVIGEKNRIPCVDTKIILYIPRMWLQSKIEKNANFFFPHKLF